MSAPNTAQGILACLTLLTIATARADAIADCLTIKADPQRLACYDNAAKAAAEARAKSGQVRARESHIDRRAASPDAMISSARSSCRLRPQRAKDEPSGSERVRFVIVGANSGEHHTGHRPRAAERASGDDGRRC